MKKFVLILLVIFTACEKDSSRLVSYRVTDSLSGFNVRYLDENGELVTDKITVQSALDVWQYNFESYDGEIVFISTNYKDPASSVKVQILIDGKLYRQSSSKNDTLSFVTVSGVIPFME